MSVPMINTANKDKRYKCDLKSNKIIAYKVLLISSKLPSDWLNANVAPIFKKGDVHLPENYRPVSLTCVSCKLLEHIICKHILDHLERNKILTSLNHGFR